MDKYKKCSECGKEFSATKEYFHVHKISKDGLRNKCKSCRTKEHEKYKLKKASLLKCGVYKIENKVNRKVYIGSSKDLNRRKNDHIATLKKGTHFRKELLEEYHNFQEKDFEFEILELVNNPIDLISREQFWLDYYNNKMPNKLYNQSPTAGSNLGFNHSAESRKKMSESRKGIKFTAKHRENISLARCGEKSCWYGKKFSDEHKRKISSAMQGVNVGENCGTHKLKESDVIEIRKLLKEGYRVCDVADMFNVDHSNISKIKNRHTWVHI